MKIFQSLLFSVLFVSAIYFTGCSEEPTSSTTPVNTSRLSKLTLPPGAVVTNATFYVNVGDPTSEDISVHKVNVPWVEATETWNIFTAKPAPLFDASLGDLLPDVTTIGYKSLDITGLVQSWLADPTSNNGVLLNQIIPSADLILTGFYSREWGPDDWTPYLEVTYTPAGGGSVTVVENAFADTYVNSNSPTQNFGNASVLYTARTSGYIKYVLVQFDIEQEVEVDCQTAYAYGGSFATCINTLPGVNNWGWTNYITDLTVDFSYDWPIYAGAAQCDISKGELVGTLHVNYYAAGDSLTVEYEIDGPCYLDVTHLWVAEGQPLPIKKQNPLTYTSAPGQFNFNFQNPVTVYDLDQPFYIAAHSVVCCPVVE